ncbi:MAG: YciI family protein [Acinetobacter sp.]
MALYVITCTDKEGTLEQRLAARPEHLTRLEKLNAEGRVLVAGPMPKQPGTIEAGFYGSVIIVDFDSREQLDIWLAEEPYVKAGVYSNVDVKPFIQVFPKG